ncbi:hypothetical protein BH10BAC5_BH10BAC5_24770 [soil metagenome]
MLKEFRYTDMSDKKRSEYNIFPHRFGISIYFLAISLFTASIFNGCASTGSGNPETDAAKIVSRVNENNSKIKNLKSEGNISFDTPDLSNSGSFTLNIVKPDSIYTKLEGPFGISIAAILMTRKDFIYYNIQDNSAIMGPSSDLNLGAILRIRLKFDDILNGFTDSFILPEPDDKTILKAVDDGYLLIFTDDSGIKKVIVDPQNFTIKKYSVYEPDGKIKMEAEYSLFSEENNYFFPNKINISKPLTKEYLQLTYTKKDFNSGSLNYRIKIPKSAKITHWN